MIYYIEVPVVFLFVVVLEDKVYNDNQYHWIHNHIGEHGNNFIEENELYVLIELVIKLSEFQYTV